MTSLIEMFERHDEDPSSPPTKEEFRRWYDAESEKKVKDYIVDYCTRWTERALFFDIPPHTLSRSAVKEGMTREKFARGIAHSETIHDVRYTTKYRSIYETEGCRQRGHCMTLEDHDHDGSSLPLDTHLMLFSFRDEYQ